jgi:thymidylate kinase
MIIELFGQMGAGKTTVSSAVNTILHQRHYRTYDLNEAIILCLERSFLGRSLQRLFPISAGRRARLLKLIYSYGLYPLYWLRFALFNMKLVSEVYQSQIDNRLPWWHRRIILHLFFKIAVAYLFLQDRLRSSEAVILEEGLIHRAVNLYAWQMKGIEHDRVRQYFRLLPAPDWVIQVHAPTDVCAQRCAVRGLPLRLRDKDEDTVALFFQNAAEIVNIAGDYLPASGRTVIMVDNSGCMGEFVPGLERKLETDLFNSGLQARQAELT